MANRSPRDDALSGLRTYICTQEALVDHLEEKVKDYEAAEHVREAIHELRRALTWLEANPEEKPTKLNSGVAISKDKGYTLQNATFAISDEENDGSDQKV